MIFFGSNEYLIEYSISLLDSYFDSKMQYSSIIPLLYHTGYLTIKSRCSENSETVYLGYPNKELKLCLRAEYMSWFGFEIDAFCCSLNGKLSKGNVKGFIEEIQVIINACKSFYDQCTKKYEKGYHNFLCGLLIYTLNSYEVQSNVSCVNGRADIIVISKNKVFPSYVLELKLYRSKSRTPKKTESTVFKKASIKALNQIEEKEYYRFIPAFGTRMVYLVGLVFYQKSVFGNYKKIGDNDSSFVIGNQSKWFSHSLSIDFLIICTCILSLENILKISYYLQISLIVFISFVNMNAK